MQARKQVKQPTPTLADAEHHSPTSIHPHLAAPSAAMSSDQQAAWKQNWLNQADRRGAIWHALWKEALGAKRTNSSAAKSKKKP